MSRIIRPIAIAAAITLLMSSWACAVSNTLPGIRGTVYFDQDFNGVINAGEALSGAMLKLYRDDGDGIAELGADDVVVGTASTAGNGGYNFANLPTGSNYFVERPAQMLNGMNVPADVSSLINPGAPSVFIDDFSDSQGAFVDQMGPVATSSLAKPTTTAIGGERDMYVELMYGIGEAELRSKAFGMDVLQYDTTSGVVGSAIVTWDGRDGSGSPVPKLGLNGLDLTRNGDDTGFLLRVGVDPTGTGEDATLKIFQGERTRSSEASFMLPVTDGRATGLVFVPFSDFLGPVSPADVDAIQLVLGNNIRSIDAQFDYVGTVGPTMQNFAVVPEPSAILLAIVGLLSMFGLRNKAR